MAARAGEPPDALALLGATKRYGSTHALRGVDLHVPAGGFLTLLGPSGSGKTTALMLWAGFVEPTSGAVMIGNRDVRGVPPHRRGLGMVFQHYALFPHMSVADNIAFPLVMAKWDRARIRKRLGELLELIQLTGFEARSPRQLSGGQQQRVALARALAARPPAVLMDEPLGALDRKLREELQEEFRRLHRETETTFVYVTHDQGEALSLSDRIAVMRDGRIEQVGSPVDLYERPQTAFVAGFFGDANFFEGKVLGRDGPLLAIATDRGTVIRVAADGRDPGGERLALVVRPERMRLLAGDAAPNAGWSDAAPAAGWNVVSGRIADRSYGGPTIRLRVASPEAGGRELIVTLPADAAAACEPGSAVRVGWPPSAGRIVG